MNKFKAALLAKKAPPVILTEEQYHAHDAMSQSKMKVLLENPRLFYMTYVTKELTKESTISMNFGTCLDLALTEPEKYKNLIVKNTKTTKLEGHITAEWKLKVEQFIQNLYSYEFDCWGGITFGDIINSQETTMQDMIFYTYKGIDWRMKTDFLNLENRFFIDLKSTKATTKAEFLKDFFKFGYHIQAASYVNGIKITYGLDEFEAYYVAISSVTGEIFAVKVSDKLLILGMIEIDRGCDLYNHNLKTPEWDKNDGVTELDAPQWLENLIINRSTA